MDHCPHCAAIDARAAEREGRMLAAFSRELADHRTEVRRIVHEQAEHVDAVLERLQSLILENQQLREENARLEAMLAGTVTHNSHDSDRPSVAIKILQASRSERPSIGAMLKPTSAAGWARMIGAGIGGLGIGAAFMIWHFLVK